MLGVPVRYTPQQLREWRSFHRRTWEDPNALIPARPIGFWGLCLVRRWKLAWAVFSGQMDALDWENQQGSIMELGYDPGCTATVQSVQRQSQSHQETRTVPELLQQNVSEVLTGGISSNASEQALHRQPSPQADGDGSEI